MIIVGNCIVSEDIAERRFGCDLSRCKGECCVEGDCGAPLEPAEVATLQRVLPEVEPYMTDAGREAVRQQGVSALDNEGEPCTPLIDGRECAYVAWDGDGTAYCAIEQAYRDGRIDWMKPISCHLYPIRVEEYGEFTALNYHQWEVCRQPRCTQGCGQPLYQYLKEPLIRRFGEAWYRELFFSIEKKSN